MNSLVENQINKFISDKIITKRKILSEAFNMRCEKITLNNNDIFVVKYHTNQNINFNAIISETNSLIYLLKKFPTLFPYIKYYSKNLLITDFIEHNNVKNKDYQIILANEILKLHMISNNKYGFEFDTQIGGLKQSNKYESNWVSFFTNKRLNMIYEKINKENPMPKYINQRIEKLMHNIENYLPKNPNICLLHGDLWEGNILFNDGKLMGLIDPGIYFGHHELEIAYLTWYKFIDQSFLNYYSNFINIDKYFPQYEPIYQLYFNLLNVFLWDRELYIKNTKNLLDKIFKHRD